MKAYQITVVALFVSFVVAMYAMFTQRPELLVRAVGAMGLQAGVLIYCLHKQKQAEDRAYRNKYTTVTTVQEIDESEVPAHIVAAMKANAGWDVEGFEKSLQVEEIIVPDFIVNKIKDNMDLGTDPLCRKLDSVLDELDNAIVLPPAPPQECFVL